MSGSDRYVELVQWAALLACVPAIVGLARMLGAPRAASAAAAALFVTLPGPILQSVTTQNDLVAAACIVAAALLGARGIRDGHVGTLALAGAAIGLGLGSKGTVLFALPAVLLIIGGAALQARPTRRTIAVGLASVAIGFVVFGAFQYVQNLADTGSPFGDQRDLVGRAKYDAGENAVLVLWNFVDAPGVSMPLADRFFERTASRLARYDEATPLRLGTEVDHDRISGGLVGWLVLWPAALGILLLPGMRREWRAQAGAAIGFAVTIALTITATQFNGRILLPFLALAAPLLALVARSRAALAVTFVLALATLGPCLLISPSHNVLPGAGQQLFIRGDRVDQLTALRRDQEDTIRYVNDRFGPEAPLLVLAGEDSWDYPYFGARRERRVQRVGPDGVPDGSGDALCGWLRRTVERENVAAVVVLDAPTDVPVPPAAAGPAQTSGANFVLDARRVRQECV